MRFEFYITYLKRRIYISNYIIMRYEDREERKRKET